MKKKILYLFKKEEKLILSGLLAGLALFLIYFAAIHVKLYESSAKLFVRNIPRSNVVASYGEGTTMKSESGYSNPLFNLKQILKSGKLSSNVYQTLSEKYPEDMKKLRVKSEKHWDSKFDKLLEVKIEPSTDIIKLTFNWPNKENADEVLSLIIDEFKNTNLDIRKSVETQQREYLDKQLTEVTSNLSAIRQEIKNYQYRHNAIDIDNEKVELTKAKVYIEREIELTRSEISYNQKKLEDLCAQLGMPDAGTALRASAIGEDEYLIKLNQKLSDAQQQYANMSALYTDRYPDVIAVKNEINSIEKNIQNRHQESLGKYIVQRGIYDNPSAQIVTDLARAQAEAISLESKMVALEKSINNLQRKKLAIIPFKKFNLNELLKQENALLTAYNNVKQKQLEARIKENQIVDNILIIGRPTKGTANAGVLAVKFLGFMLLGLFGGLGVAYIKDDIQDKWSNAEEIEAMTSQKVLGVLPWLKEESAIIGKNKLIHAPSSIMGVSYGNIAINLISSSYLKDAQAISFVSTSSGREKSSIIPNLAMTIAKSKRSVIVIDTDFSNPASLLSEFDIEIPKNKKDVLETITEINKNIRLFKCVNNEQINNLLQESIIPVNVKVNGAEISFNYLSAFNKTENINDYVATQGFKTIVDFLKNHFEFVLIDTPAKSFIFPEMQAVAASSDSTVIINNLLGRKEILIKTIENLEKLNQPILGVISREENSEIEKEFNLMNKDFQQAKENLIKA